MDPIVSRVAARYLESAFLPDKLWKEELSALKKLLLTPVDGPGDAAFTLESTLTAFLELLVSRLQNTGMMHHAVKTVQIRVDAIEQELQKRARDFEALEQSMYTPYPLRELEDDLAFTIVMELKEYFKSQIPTVEKALKSTWVIQPGAIMALAKKLLARATPEERKALQLSIDENYDGYYSSLRYQFHKRVNLEGLTKRLVSKVKIPIDLLSMVERIPAVLESNYTQERLSGFDDFSVGDLKVIVLNPDIWVGDSDEYAKKVIEARALLNRKGFGKLWYGVLFIVDKKFEKLSPEATAQYEELGYKNLELRAGTYHSGDDIVRITASCRDPYLIGYIVHEMGHRYWYKFMKPNQRARFNSLIQTNPSKEVRDFPSGPVDESGTEKPVTPVSNYGASTIEEAFAEVFEHYCLEKDITRDQLESFRSVLSSVEDPVVLDLVSRVLRDMYNSGVVSVRESW